MTELNSRSRENGRKDRAESWRHRGWPLLLSFLVIAVMGVATLSVLVPGTKQAQALEDPPPMEDKPPKVVDLDYRYDFLKVAVTISGKVEDDGPLKDLEVTISGAVEGTAITDPDGSFTEDFAFPTTFPAIVTAVAKDSAGQESEPAEIEIR